MAPPSTEHAVTRKSSRITVDLGDEELVKAVKIAAVEQGRTVRDIVVEALTQWLAVDRNSPSRKRGSDDTSPDGAPGGSDPDYKSMIENLNRYRGVGQ
jgi:hypothetical protein